MAITITWHGHATFSLAIDGVHVVVDPFLAGNSPVARVGPTEVPADYILQTHGHFDHILDTVALAKHTGALVIANLEIASWINSQGYEKTWGMNTGGSYSTSFGQVKMMPAWHSSGLPDGSYGGLAGGFVISTADKRIYISGDTALFSDMALIGAGGLDLAVLPTGDNFTMGPDDALLALGYLQPQVVIPCHYGTWPPIEQDMGAWAERVSAETAVTPIVLEIEGDYTL